MALLVGLIIVLVACDDTSGRPTATSVPSGTATFDQLANARNRWMAAELDSYRYVFEDDCGECQPVAGEVVVWDGEAADLTGILPTIETIFSQIDAAIAAGQSIEVSYDTEHGHPVDVWIDREARAYDGGIHWTIRDLSIGLPGDDVSVEELEAARTRWLETRPAAYEFKTAIVCDCELAGRIWTRVEGSRIADWEVQLTSEAEATVSPITIEDMFDDLAEMLESGDVADGIRVTGSAEYDPILGYPTWIGLDIEVLDPDAKLAYLPPRLVFMVGDLHAVEPDLDGDAGATGNDLVVARQRWQAAGLVDYEYGLTVHDIETASFSDLYTVTVIGGAVVSVTLNDQPVDDPEVPALAIEQLFDRIELWSQSGAEVDVLYDLALGHPVVVVTRSIELPPVLSISDLRAR